MSRPDHLSLHAVNGFLKFKVRSVAAGRPSRGGSSSFGAPRAAANHGVSGRATFLVLLRITIMAAVGGLADWSKMGSSSQIMAEGGGLISPSFSSFTRSAIFAGNCRLES